MPMSIGVRRQTNIGLFQAGAVTGMAVRQQNIPFLMLRGKIMQLYLI
jgi:hypothetical protein